MDKQIEEMAKDLLDFGMATYPTGDSVFTETKLREQFYHVFLAYAEHLIKNGYRKITEGAVVLTREEYKRLCDLAYFGNGEETVRKETAEKFAERLKNEVLNFCGTVKENGYFERGKISFCEDIDEICKELTGDK